MLPWFSIISLILYIPIICYLDWKHRDIGTHKLWLPLLAINIPVTAAGYLTGLYSPIMLILTLAFSITWFLLLKHRGTDCVWLICITMFVVVNPRTGMNFIQPFLMYLIIFTLGAMWYSTLDQIIIQRKRVCADILFNLYIPNLLVISLAFIAALVM